MRQHYKFMNFAQVDFLGFGVKFCKQNTKRNSENGFMKQLQKFSLLLGCVSDFRSDVGKGHFGWAQNNILAEITAQDFEKFF